MLILSLYHLTCLYFDTMIYINLDTYEVLQLILGQFQKTLSHMEFHFLLSLCIFHQIHLLLLNQVLLIN